MKGTHYEKRGDDKEKILNLQDICVCASESRGIIGGIDAEYYNPGSRRRYC